METQSRKGIGGPKTPGGRARSALNAVKHGLTSVSPVVLHHETEAEWQAHREGVLQSLAPVGHLEQVLAEKIALTLWRQARIAAYETLRTNQRLERAPSHVEESLWPHATPADVEHRLRSALVDWLLLDEVELRKLQRYEGHLGRELSRLFKHFHHLRSLRLRPQPECEADPRPRSLPASQVPPPPAVSQPEPATKNDETNSAPPVAEPVPASHHALVSPSLPSNHTSAGAPDRKSKSVNLKSLRLTPHPPLVKMARGATPP